MLFNDAWSPDHIPYAHTPWTVSLTIADGYFDYLLVQVSLKQQDYASKVKPHWGSKHDLQIMDCTFHVFYMLVLTTER